jgi:hypothetical protein
MSALYASLTNERNGSATRSSESEISAHVRGWSVGVRVDATLRDGQPVLRISATYGSEGGGPDREIGYVTEMNGSPVFESLETASR